MTQLNNNSASGSVRKIEDDNDLKFLKNMRLRKNSVI